MIIVRTRVIGTSETHVPYRTIQDVVLNQGIVDRMLGIANVTVQNAAQTIVGRNGRAVTSGSSFIAQPIDKANELVAIVRKIMGEANASGTGL